MRVHWLPAFATLSILTVPVYAETSAARPEASTGAPAAAAPKTAAAHVARAAEHPVALAVSSPLGWLNDSFGASAYVALGRNHALRGNLASYRFSEPLLLGVAVAVMGGDSAYHGGRITDIGAAWVWYPRRLWSGPAFEAGLIRRGRDTAYQPEFDDRIETASTTYAGRAMVGWSWLFGGRVFISLAVGLSAGRESGRETITPDSLSRMPTTNTIERLQVDGEAYLRIGLAFGG